jgi:hypothetical protein
MKTKQLIAQIPTPSPLSKDELARVIQEGRDARMEYLKRTESMELLSPDLPAIRVR